jgi:hypothetical protein
MVMILKQPVEIHSKTSHGHSLGFICLDEDFRRLLKRMIGVNKKCTMVKDRREYYTAMVANRST